LETSLTRQSLALVLATQNKQETIHQKHKINKLAIGKKNTQKILNKQAPTQKGERREGQGAEMRE